MYFICFRFVRYRVLDEVLWKHQTPEKEKIKKIKKGVDFSFRLQYNNSCLTDETETKHNIGVWLSLARAPGLGPGGRRFESCHPDSAGVVQWQNTSLPSWIRGFDSHHPLFLRSSVGNQRKGEYDMSLQLSWIEQRPSKPQVEGSNPPRLGMVGMVQLVSASDCGSGYRGFESHYPPFSKEN